MKRNKVLFSTVLFLTVVTLIVSINVTAAQTPAQIPIPTATLTATPVSTPISTPTADVRVIDVYKYGKQEEKNIEVRNSSGIGDIIVIKVSNLQSLVNQAKCLDVKNQTVPNCQEQEIALFLEGRKINGIVPISGAPRLEEETLQFRLERNAGNKEAWTDLLGAPPFLNNESFKRPTQVSVGLENSYAELTNVTGEKFKLVRIRQGLFWVCSIGLIALAVWMTYLARNTDILRDLRQRSFDSKAPKPYSLSRFQMAWWFFWVITSFVFIWQITGAYDIITPSALGLIGISASTALGAVAIDVSKIEDISSQLSRLKEEELILDNEIAALTSQAQQNPQPTNLNQLEQDKVTKQGRLKVVKTQIETLNKKQEPQESLSFWNDIFTDGHGSTSFHRLQIFVWTIVLWLLFISSVWSRLSMPEFDSTLLALQGISAGTYLGFKIPEKQI